MDSEMIERAAEAIFKSLFHSTDVATEAQIAEHRAWFVVDWHRSERAARAAVEAMRDLIPVVRDEEGFLAHQLVGAPGDIWRTMIDAALSLRSKGASG